MRVQARFSALRGIKWYEYLLRFAFGGIVTVLAGMIADRYGAVIGGLFLAFPSIFPATVTLVEKHEKQQRQRAGMNGIGRGREAAAVDARGSAIGCMGLLAFALVVWRGLPGHGTWLVLGMAAVAWVAVAILAWWVAKRL